MYICISLDSPIVRDLRKLPKIKPTNNTSKDTHRRAKSTKSINQILLFHHFRAIIDPLRRRRRRRNDDDHDAAVWTQRLPLPHHPSIFIVLGNAIGDNDDDENFDGNGHEKNKTYEFVAMNNVIDNGNDV